MASSSLFRTGRRTVLSLLAAALGTGLLSGGVHAQEPQRVTLVVGYPPGGATDALARTVAEGLRAQLGTAVLVENKPGAGGRIATEFVKNAKPDGTTLLFSISSPIVIYPHIYRKLGYKPLEDFLPIGVAARSTLGLTVGPAVPQSVKTVADYVAWTKANPRMATFGTVSGTAPHFAGLLFAHAVGINLQLIPYKGGTPAVTDMMGGNLPATVTPVAEVQPFHAAGRVRTLATMGPQRPKVMPDVPTMMELGYKDVNFQTWIGILAPASTPADTVTRLNEALARVLAQKDIVANIEKLGMEPLSVSPDRFREIIRNDYELFRKSVEMTGFKPED